MKIKLQTGKKITQKTSPILPIPNKRIKSKSRSIDNNENGLSSVLEIDDYGTFIILDELNNNKMIEGRISEISREEYQDYEQTINNNGNINNVMINKVLYIFVIDISKEYQSNFIEIRSDKIVSWTKAGCDTILWEDVINCMYTDDKYMIIEDDNSISYINEGEIVEVTDIIENFTMIGRVSNISQYNMTIDFSEPSKSNVKVYNSEYFNNLKIKKLK